MGIDLLERNIYIYIRHNNCRSLISTDEKIEAFKVPKELYSIEDCLFYSMIHNLICVLCSKTFSIKRIKLFSSFSLNK